MDVHEYLGVLRRGLVFIALGVLIGLLGGLGAQSMETRTYAATSRDLVTNKTSGDLSEWLQASSFTQSRIASYVLVASSGLVLQPVIDDLGLDTTVDDLARQITVTAPPSTFIIEITATAATPALARDIANAVSAEFGDVVSNQLETTEIAATGAAGATPTPGATPGAAVVPTPTPTVTTLPDGTVVPIAKPIAPVRIVNIEEAVLPTGPLPSNGGLFLIVGGVLGLAAGLLAASLREAFDTRVRGPRDIARVARIPVVGDIPADRAVWTTPLVSRSEAGPPISEAFRALRAHLDHLRSRQGGGSFVLTASAPRQGTTTITANLAVALANTATSVVVVDADLRSSALSRLFGIHGALGLTEVLTGRAILDAALHSSDGGRLTVLPAGGRPSNPGELLATPTMRELLAELRRRFEVVLIDAPPISEVTDAAVLGSFDSATVLVLTEGRTTKPKLEDALAQLAAGGSTPIGIVLNTIPRRRLFGLGARLPEVRETTSTAPAFVPRYEPAVEREVPVPVPVPVPAPARAPEPVAAPVAAKASASRRVTQPVTSAPVPAEAAAEPAREPAVLPAPAPAAAPAAAPTAAQSTPARSDPLPTAIEHSLTSARNLDSAFAALPTATAAEQRAGAITPEIERSRPAQVEHAVERPIVIKPDPPKPSSRFAPDPTRFIPRMGSAYATAPAPRPEVTGTVVNTVSIRIPSEVSDAATIPPPIRHILPSPTASTIPPRELAAVRRATEEADTVPPAAAPVPLPPEREDAPDSLDAAAPEELEVTVVPFAGSLLGEIGGLPRVEVRAVRPTAVTDTAPDPERQARESYETRARELERAAHERLMREQQRLAVSIREQLAHDKRELESVLDNRLEDTVLRPVVLTPRRAADPRFSDPADDDGETR